MWSILLIQTGVPFSGSVVLPKENKTSTDKKPCFDKNIYLDEYTSYCLLKLPRYSFGVIPVIFLKKRVNECAV